MSTANKLTYLNTTKTKLKDMINYGLDNDNKITDETTFRNYNNSLFNAYIETINDPSTLYNNLPKVSGSGTDITLDNTKETRMELKLKGDTSQYTTTGKQFFNAYAINVTGIEVTNNGATITMPIVSSGNGYKSTGKKLSVLCPNLQVGDNVYMYFTCTSTANKQIYTTDGSYWVNGTNKTITQNMLDGIVVLYSNNYTQGETTANVYSNLRVVKTQNDTFEPYTAGASPNPSYPQNIEVVTGEQNIKIQNKNLLDFDAFLNSASATFTKNNGQYSITNVGSLVTIRYQLNLLPNTQYTLSCKEQTNTTTSLRIQVYEENTYKYRVVSSGTSEKSVTFTTNSSSNYYLNMTYSGTISYPLLWKNVMLEKGNSATDYVAHQEQNYEIDLGTTELCKIGTYQDYIYKSGSDWKIHREIGKVVLNGTESWAQRTDIANLNNTACFRCTTGTVYENAKVGEVFVTDRFTCIDNTDDLEHVRPIQSSETYRFTAFINKTRLDTIDTTGWKSWLSSNNVITYYPLATPTEETITDTDLIDDLNALYYATSYNEQTNINSRGNIASLLNANAIQGLSE